MRKLLLAATAITAFVGAAHAAPVTSCDSLKDMKDAVEFSIQAAENNDIDPADIIVDKVVPIRGEVTRSDSYCYMRWHVKGGKAREGVAHGYKLDEVVWDYAGDEQTKEVGAADHRTVWNTDVIGYGGQTAVAALPEVTGILSEDIEQGPGHILVQHRITAQTKKGTEVFTVEMVGPKVTVRRVM